MQVHTTIRNKWRRFRLAPIPYGLILVIALTSCGFIGDGLNSPPKGTAEATTLPKGDLPRRDLVFYLPGIAQKDQMRVNTEINQVLLNNYNCTLDIRVTDWNTWNSQYPILLSSGDRVDMMFTASYYGYFQEVAKNTFLPLDNLMAQYGQDIPGVMLDGYLDAARVKGKLYAIPVNKDTGQGWGIVANREMAEDIGTDLGGVVRLEDLEPVLARAKEKLPEGVVPFFIGNELSMLQLAGTTTACAEIGFSDRSRFVQLDDQLYYDNFLQKALPLYRIPQFLDQCALVNRWFQKGYINKDLLTTQVTAREMMGDDKAFIHVQAQSPIHQVQWENETGKKLISVEFVKGVKETQSMTGALTAIPRSCADPDRAMMVINAFMTNAALKNLFTWGIEGMHYTAVDEKTIRLPEGISSANDTGYNPGNFWMFGNAYLLKVWDNEPPKKWDYLRVYCEVMPKSPLLGFSFDSSPVKAEVAAHANVMKEKFRLLANGVLQPDAIAAEIEKADMLAGIDRICAEIDRQVQDWKKTQKP